MILKSISLRNIRSYTDQTIEFPLGTSLFEGDIGSGKSTILMAIEFALFGLGSQRGASLLRLGENSGSVSLSFSVNDSDFEITRILKKKKNLVNQDEGSITTSQGILPLSPAELKERVLDILHFKESSDPKAQSVIYRYAVFTPQEEMKLILAKNPKERIQTLRKAFGIEDYKIASDNATILAVQIKDNVSKLKGQTEDLEEKRNELKSNEHGMKDLELDKKKLDEEHKTLEALQNNEKRELDKIRKEEHQYNEANSKIPLIVKDIEEKSRNIDGFRRQQLDLQKEIDNELKPQIIQLSNTQKPTNKTKQQLTHIINELRKLEKKKNELMGEKPTLIRSIERRKKKLGEYEKKSAEQIRKEISDAGEERNKISSRLEEIDANLKRIEKQKATLEKNRSKIERRMNELRGERPGLVKSIDKRKKKLGEYEKKSAEQIRKEISDDEKNIREIEKRLEETDSRLKDIRKRRTKLELTESDFEQKIDELKGLKGICPICERELTPTHKKHLKAERETKLQEIKSKMPEIEQEEQRLESVQKESDKMLNELKGRVIELKTLEREASELQEESERLSKITEEVQKTNTKLQEINSDITKVETEEQRLESVQKESDKMLNELKGRVIELKTLEREASELQEESERLSKITEEVRVIGGKLKVKEEKDFKGLANYENPSEYMQALLDVLTEYISSVDKKQGLEKNVDKNEGQIRDLKKEIERTNGSIEQSQIILKKLESVLHRLKEIPLKVTELDKQIEKRDEDLKELVRQISENDGRQKELQTTNSRLISEISKKEKAKNLMEKFQEYHLWISDFLIPTFQVIERQVMITIKQEFESIFQKWYSMLLDEPDKETRIDEDFTPIVEQDGYEQDVSYLSGGERTSLALAYRLALNTIVQRVSVGMKSNLLILDEPTDGFSKSQLFKVRDILRELNCQQTIIVSHETELESFANKIFEVTKSNGISSIISR